LSNYFIKNSNEIVKTSNVIAYNKRPELKINTDEIQNKMHKEFLENNKDNLVRP